MRKPKAGFPLADGVSHYTAYTARAHFWGRCTAAAVAALVGVGLCAALYSRDDAISSRCAMVAALFGVVLLGIWLTKPNAPFGWLSERKYNSIDGSHDADGEHQCVFCGHHGIHRRTPYQETTTEARCSNCKTPLWTESA